MPIQNLGLQNNKYPTLAEELKQVNLTALHLFLTHRVTLTSLIGMVEYRDDIPSHPLDFGWRDYVLKLQRMTALATTASTLEATSL